MTLEPGKKIGEWTLLEKADARYWLCQCSCGRRRRVRTSNMLSGMSNSCGHNTAKRHAAVMAAAFNRS